MCWGFLRCGSYMSMRVVKVVRLQRVGTGERVALVGGVCVVQWLRGSRRSGSVCGGVLVYEG